ncbi:MAG: short-chain fatty acid transporter [Desulfobacteraceae bacterium]|nr:short-chain fatty acid transporter [Desulfobacteraceae bacterium]
MVQSIAGSFTKVVRRWLPDAFLFAVILTFAVFAFGILFKGQSPVDMVKFWGQGFWKLLAFAMQMVLVLVTGHTLAKTKAVESILISLSKLAHTPAQAIVVTTFFAMLACWLNWGFGLIVGALLAKQMAKRIKGIHYGLLVASAYSGFIVWHAGISGSIPLKVAQVSKNFMSRITGEEVIPVIETIFTWQNLLLCLFLMITLPIINKMMIPDPEDIVEIDPALLEESAGETEERPGTTPAERIENSRVVSMLLGLFGFSYIVCFFVNGGTLGLNSVNMIFLFAGIVLHGTPANFLKAANEAIKNTSGIVLQFPLYAGIMGMMVHSGLASSISQWFVQVSTPVTFPFLTFLSAGIVNFFVPSGGGQWAVQGPIVMPAAKALGVPLGKAAMAIAWGDAWTNMIQPFWALPLLGIAGLGIRDIMGYCVVALLWGGGLISLFLLFL